jgi:hypothetical protein
MSHMPLRMPPPLSKVDDEIEIGRTGGTGDINLGPHALKPNPFMTCWVVKVSAATFREPPLLA